MRGEEGFSRFFAYTNLFIASMLCLVLADDLLFVYLGWEGVGLCSYLLIGFYYRDPANGAAALKAFIVTRVGDVFLLAIGLFLLYQQFGTLHIADLLRLAQEPQQASSDGLYWACLMLLGGAVGKSAQLPLQTWLADAMAGPTPVSALIHAATMVTAGVYLIARTHGLFLQEPEGITLGRDDRSGYSSACWICRPGPDRYQTYLGVFNDESNWIYVPGSRSWGMGRGDLPPDDTCVFQGVAVSVGRFRHHCDAS